MKRTRRRQKKLDVGRTAREILRNKHGFPEAHHCTNRWKGRSYLVAHLPALHLFSSEGLSLVGIDGDRSTAVGGVQSVEKDMNGEHPTGFWTNEVEAL